MTSMDRREFVIGLTAAVGALSLAGCGGQNLQATSSRLLELFGEDEAWKVLGDDYLSSFGTTSEQALEVLGTKLSWRPKQGVDALVQQVVSAIREDFNSGALQGPGGWSLSETELQIYAVLGAAQAEPEAAS